MLKMVAVIFMCIIIPFSGCSKEKSEIEIPKDIKATKLSDILNNPVEYNGKKVLLSGFVVSVCPSGCDMVYQEDNITTEIYPKGFKIPRMKKGQPIKIYAEVTAGKERVIVSALKIEKQGEPK